MADKVKTDPVKTGKVRVSSQEHQDRLAAALRANLRRRKRQHPQDVPDQAVDTPAEDGAE